MKRLLGAVVMAGGLVLATVAPASAADGILLWTFDGGAWYVHQNPAVGCYTVSEGDPTSEFQNRTEGPVAVYMFGDCAGPLRVVESGGETGFPARSYRVLD